MTNRQFLEEITDVLNTLEFYLEVKVPEYLEKLESKRLNKELKEEFDLESIKGDLGYYKTLI